MTRLLAAIVWIAASAAAQSLADGIAAVESARFEDAVKILTDVVTRDPKSFDANFYLGLAHFRAGHPDRARPYLVTATTLAPERDQAWKLLGLVTTTAGDLDAAVVALRRACDLAPTDQESCYYLARDLFALGQYTAAQAPFDRALRAAPPSMLPRIHRAVALNFVALGAAADAERHFLEAIRLTGPNPRNSDDPRVDYGAFLFRQGRTEAALRPLEQAVHDSPDSARANLELGRVLLHLDRLERAVAALEKAVRLAPADANGHLLLGRAYLRSGRTEEGEREMRLGQKAWEGKK